MRLCSIIIGSWFPKTSVHFNEFYNFLINKNVIPSLNLDKAKDLHKRLTIKSIHLTNENNIRGLQVFSGVFEFCYYEDGLLTVQLTTADVKRAKKQIEKFYNKVLTPILSYLYSSGAKGMEIIRLPGSEKTIYLLAQNPKKEDAELLYQGQKYTTTKLEGKNVFTSGSQTLIDNSISENAKKNLINFLIFYNEAKKHADALLQTHRYIWDDAEKLVSSKSVIASKLIDASEKLSEHAKNVSNIQNRIEQIQLNIDFRKQHLISTSKLITTNYFDEISYLFDYLKNIFLMTEKNLINKINHLNSAYSEQQQRSLNQLQFIFLIGVVVSFITLGAFPSAKLFFYNQLGEPLATADLLSFDFKTLLLYGTITIAATIFISLLWALLFKKTRIKK